MRNQTEVFAPEHSSLNGVLAGLLVKTLCSEDLAIAIAKYVFGTGSRLFFNAVKMIIPFLVSMAQTLVNVTSTAVCTFIVDRWEKEEAGGF